MTSRWAKLPTEQTLPAAARLDELSAEEVVGLLAREERKSVAAVDAARRDIAAVAEQAARALAAGGRLIYAGAGTSGRLCALDAAECPPTFGTRPSQVIALVAGGPRALRSAVEGAEDDEAAGAAAARAARVSRRDLVVGVTASGVTPFVRGALAAARRAGARTALVTCGARGVPADHTIALRTGPEVIAGSTRLKAGTATKLALNAISTAAMVRLGKCYGPRMVDLRATSAKLRDRARRMVMGLLDIDGEDADRLADRLLRAAGGSVKVAVVMGWLGVKRREAETLLAAVGGRLRAVLQSKANGLAGAAARVAGKARAARRRPEQRDQR